MTKKTDPIKEKVTCIEHKIKDLIKERSTIESVRDIINEDKEIGKVRKDIVKETLAKFERQKSLIKTSKKDNSTLRGKLKEEIEQEMTNTIVQDKAKEMVERQNSEKLCRKLKTKDVVGKDIEDMQNPKGNSSLKESLHRKLETKDEIGKVNKGRKNNNGNLKEKTNSDSVVEKVEVVNKKDKKEYLLKLKDL